MNIAKLRIFDSDGKPLQMTWRHRITFSLRARMKHGKYGPHKEYSAPTEGWQTAPAGWIDVDTEGNIVHIGLTDHGKAYGLRDDEKIDASTYGTDLSVKYLEQTADIWVDGVHYEVPRNMFYVGCGSKRAYTSTDPESGVTDFFCNEIRLTDGWPARTLTDDFSVKLPDGPSSLFMASLYTEPVSAGLPQPETLFIMEETPDGLRRPSDPSYGLTFTVTSDSTLRFVKDSLEWWDDEGRQQGSSYEELDHSKVYWSRIKSYDLPREAGISVDGEEPLVLTPAFRSNAGGCYEDMISVWTLSPAGELIQAGWISVKSEAVDEDERFRTLFTNFGVPDPKWYPHVFKDYDDREDGMDWNFINKKSKELFLTYDQIFPYAGTYKALMNAVSYLGWDDVYFKEWYRFFDGEKENDIAYQKIDITQDLSVRRKLEAVGISPDQFLKWKKLNILSMLYRINREKAKYDTVAATIHKVNPDTGDYYYTEGLLAFDIPVTKNEYKYYNSELLAKLEGLKEWLERHIVGINCRIKDITGEGVYFNRVVTTAYSTGHITIEEEHSRSVTPIWIADLSHTQLEDSSAKITLSLKEFGDTVTTADTSTLTAADFIKWVGTGSDDMRPVTSLTDDELAALADPASKALVFGAVGDMPVEWNDVGYELRADVSCGAWKSGLSHPLLVKDNEIIVHGGRTPSSAVITRRALPIIRMRAGELRKCYGPWEKNVLYTVSSYAGNTGWNYEIHDEIDPDRYLKSKDWITLRPGPGAMFEYTSMNKYRVPLFILSNYVVSSIEGGTSFLPEDTRLILTLSDGFIEKLETVWEGSGYDGPEAVNAECRARIIFDSYNSRGEQLIYMRYVYRTGRVPAYSFLTDAERDRFLADWRAMRDSALTGRLGDITDAFTREFSAINDKYDTMIEALDARADKYGDRVQALRDELADREMTATRKRIINSSIDSILKWLDRVPGMKERYEEERQAELANADERYKAVYKAEETRLEARLDDSLTALQAARTVRYKEWPIWVNHRADWSLYATVWDNWNTPYRAKAESVIPVTGKAPSVEIIREYLSEDPDSAPESVRAAAISQADILAVTDNCTVPEFWPDVRRSVTRSADGMLQYRSHSYAMHMPEEGEWLHVTNVSERVDSVIETVPESDETNGGRIRVMLNDENPRGNETFYADCSVMLYYVNPSNNNAAASLSCSGPYKVIDYKEIPEYDLQEPDDNFIELSYCTKEDEYVKFTAEMHDAVAEGRFDCFIAPVTEFLFTYDTCKNDYETDTCRIRIRAPKRVLLDGQVVKVMYWRYQRNFDSWSEADREYLINAATRNRQFISGDTYKVLSGEDNGDGTWTFTIDGTVNDALLRPFSYRKGDPAFVNGLFNNDSDPFSVRACITPSLSSFVMYTAEASGDAVEDADTMLCDVPVSNKWHIDRFTDRSFSINVYDFRADEAFREWGYDDLDKSLIHYRSPIPCEIEPEEGLLAVSDDRAGTYCEGSISQREGDLNYMCLWTVRHATHDDARDASVLFRSINETLPLKGVREGVYHIGLETIDMFGNLLGGANNCAYVTVRQGVSGSLYDSAPEGYVRLDQVIRGSWTGWLTRDGEKSEISFRFSDDGTGVRTVRSDYGSSYEYHDWTFEWSVRGDVLSSLYAGEDVREKISFTAVTQDSLTGHVTDPDTGLEFTLELRRI